MKRGLVALAAASVLVVLGALLLLAAAIDDSPAATPRAALSRADIADAERSVSRSRWFSDRTTDTHQLTLNERQVTLALDYALRRYAHGQGNVHIEPGRIDLVISVPLPENPLGLWLNARASFSDGPGLPPLTRLSLGRTPIPVFLVRGLVYPTLIHFGGAEMEMLLAKVQEVHFGRHTLAATWQGRVGIADAAALSLLRPSDLEPLRAANARLARLLQHAGTHISAGALLSAMMRGAENDHDEPIASNRAILISLAALSAGRKLPALFESGVEVPGEHILTLRGREDLAQHFLVSAALAATGASRLADVSGVYKELRDAKVGSGFSFTDLAADRTGQRFGQAATVDDVRARHLRQWLAFRPDERHFMPDVADLPERMNAAEFTRRFKGIGSPEYIAVEREIERRIAAMPLY